MLALFSHARLELHHRIGDLEIDKSHPLYKEMLHHRIGDLEKTAALFAA